jgi:hypothetical protein
LLLALLQLAAHTEPWLRLQQAASDVKAGRMSAKRWAQRKSRWLAMVGGCCAAAVTAAVMADQRNRSTMMTPVG